MEDVEICFAGVNKKDVASTAKQRLRGCEAAVYKHIRHQTAGREGGFSKDDWNITQLHKGCTITIALEIKRNKFAKH